MRLLLLFAFLLFSFAVCAQSSDCETAVSVCNNVYQETDSPSGTGNVFEMAPGTCQTGGEFNSAWYVFSPQSDGAFGFVLEPNGNFDDYDWSLFNITENGCEGINSGASPEVSCNSYGSFSGFQGPTGISSANGGSGNSNGPGENFGPPFNADLQVQSGQVYALVVMNFSATLNGYTLDFSNSDVPIFDQEPPALISAELNCDNTSIVFTFSESVHSSMLTAGNIQLTCNGEVATVTGVFGINTDFISSFSVDISGWSNVSGPASIAFTQPVTDNCGNVYGGPFSFDVAALPEVILSSTPACEEVGGGISVQVQDAGSSCFTFSTSAGTLIGATCTSATFGALADGMYTVTATNEENCTFEESIAVFNIDLTALAGDDATLCDLQTTLSGVAGAGTVQWSGPAGVSFVNSALVNTAVSVLVPGTYVLTLQVSQGSCQVSDDVSIVFQNPPNIDVSVTDAVCYDDCNGKVRVFFAAGEVVATLGNQTLTGQDVLFENICRGDVNLFVNFGEGCNASYMATVGSLPELTGEIVALPYVQSIDNPVFQLKATAFGTDSIEWEIPATGSTNDVMEWQVTMPALPGAYDVLLTLLGDSGCTSVVRTKIYVKDNFMMFVPTAFTPDNDGVNDYFIPSLTYAPVRYRLMIFDRWGTVFFDTTDPAQKWLGEGVEGNYYVGNDVYTWKITVELDDSEARVYTGTVTVLR